MLRNVMVGDCFSVAVSPSLVAVACGMKTYLAYVELLDPATGKHLNTLFGHKNDVRCVAFSPHDNGRLLASASYDGTVRLWDTQTKECIRIFTCQDNNAGPDWDDHVYSVAFSPDGSLLAFACADQTVRLLNMPEGLPKFILRGHTTLVYCVAFSSCGRLLASGSWDHTVRLWNTLNGEPGLVLRHPTLVFSVNFSPLPNSYLLATGCYDGVIRLWDTCKADEKTPFREWKAHVETGTNYTAMSVQFSPDGRQLASASNDKTVKLWNLDGKLLRTLKGHCATVRSAVFDCNGYRILSGSHDGWLRISTVCEWSDRLHYLRLFDPDLTRIVFVLMCVKARQDSSKNQKMRLPMQIWLLIFYQLSLLYSA